MSKVNAVVFIITLLTLIWNGYKTYNTHNSNEISMKDAEQLNANSHYIVGILDKSFISNDKLEAVYEDLVGFDPRLTTAIWIRMISDHLLHNSDEFDANFKLPLLWKYLIEDVDLDSTGWLGLTGPLNYSLPKPLMRSVGKHYLLNTAPIPDRIVLIGCGQDGDNLVIPTFPVLDLHNYIEDETLFTQGVSLNVELEKLGEIWNNSSSTKLSHNFEVSLNNSDFEFDPPLFDNNQDKFFHEANILGSKLGQHFDWRFFDKTNYSPYERKAILHHLSRAWLRFANSIGLKTWLAHGTLLGWYWNRMRYWNGMSLPWDEDMDVQITAQSLAHLASNYNNSLMIDLSNDGSRNRGIRRYLLEVGPNFGDRDNANGENNIDARFIDLESGFYVDITALALSTSIDDMNFNSSDAFNQVLDEYYMEQKLSNTISSQELFKKWELERSRHKRQQDIYNCRNNHFYLLEDLSPMIITLFEGVRALVPRKFKQILQREYPKGLRNYQYADHTYRPVLRLWVPDDICKKDKIGNECHHQETLMEAGATREMTQQHRQQVVAKFATVPDEDIVSSRVDPWIIRRSQWLNQRLIAN